MTNGTEHSAGGTHSSAALPSGSFRDPGGRLFTSNGRVLRCITPSGRANLEAALRSPTVQRWMAAGRIVATGPLLTEPPRDVAAIEHRVAPEGAVWVEHERIPFPSYPYEWAPAMLAAAARLTLELAQELLDEGLGLKDASPFNILFRGPEPVFVDLLSVEQRDPRDPLWLPYAQLIRTFLLPLWLYRRKQFPLDAVFIPRREGLDLRQVYRLCSPLERLLPPGLGWVTLPVWLERWADRKADKLYRPRRTASPVAARFALERLYRGLERSLHKLERPTAASSRWVDYVDSCPTYTREQWEQKVRWVEHVLDACQPRRLLDVGANTGFFSLLAARRGVSVVAIDTDSAALDQLWHHAHAERRDVLPLVVNFSQPSPATGWKNTECLSFPARACGHFDMVFLLALLHHVLVTDRVPLEEVVEFVAELTTRFALVEFIGREDPAFQRLVRGRDPLYQHITPEWFERTVTRHFEILQVERLARSHRVLYLLRRRSS